MKRYLLNVTFYAGSDDPEDTDRGMFVLNVDKEITESEMEEIFETVNEILNIDFADDLSEEYGEEYLGYPCYYETGINIHTLMEGIELYTKGQVKELKTGRKKIKDMDAYYIIEQWQ